MGFVSVFESFYASFGAITVIISHDSPFIQRKLHRKLYGSRNFIASIWHSWLFCLLSLNSRTTRIIKSMPIEDLYNLVENYYNLFSLEGKKKIETISTDAQCKRMFCFILKICIDGRIKQTNEWATKGRQRIYIIWKRWKAFVQPLKN